MFTLVILLLILLWGAVAFAYIMANIRNLSGFNMAMSWLINFGLTLLNCYLFSGPILTAIKAKLILKYGFYRRRQPESSFRSIMYFLFISDLDLALLKEFKECIKNKKEDDEVKKSDESENANGTEVNRTNSKPKSVDASSKRQLKDAISSGSKAKEVSNFKQAENQNEEVVQLTLNNKNFENPEINKREV